MEKNMTIVFSEPNEIHWEERDIPKPKENELLIKTITTMISPGTEFSVLEGENINKGSAWDKYGTFPFTPGYNNIGVIIDVGNGIEKSWIGKKIATYGIHAQYIIANIEDARIINRDIKNEHAIFFTFAEIVMQGIRRGNVKWGDILAVYGLGILGQLVVRFSRMCGAKPVFAIDINNMRLDKIPKEKGIIPINPKQQNIKYIIEEKTRNRMVDIVYEVTGVAELIPSEFDILRQMGRFVVLSSPRGKTDFDFHDLCNSPSYTIIGSHNYSHVKYESPDNPWTYKRDAEFFFDMIADKEIELDSLITSCINYTKAVDMYYNLLNDRSNEMGIVIEWT